MRNRFYIKSASGRRRKAEKQILIPVLRIPPINRALKGKPEPLIFGCEPIERLEMVSDPRSLRCIKGRGSCLFRQEEPKMIIEESALEWRQAPSRFVHRLLNALVGLLPSESGRLGFLMTRYEIPGVRRYGRADVAGESSDH